MCQKMHEPPQNSGRQKCDMNSSPTGDPKTLDATVKIVVATAICRTAYVHPCHEGSCVLTKLMILVLKKQRVTKFRMNRDDFNLQR